MEDWTLRGVGLQASLFEEVGEEEDEEESNLLAGLGLEFGFFPRPAALAEVIRQDSVALSAGPERELVPMRVHNFRRLYSCCSH